MNIFSMFVVLMICVGNSRIATIQNKVLAGGGQSSSPMQVISTPLAKPIYSMEEIWKTVSECPVYEVSNFGNVRRYRSIKNLGVYYNHNGYRQVVLSHNHKTLTRRVHRLVALHFVDNPEKKTDVNHINGNKKDNRASNLEWCTCKENIHHSMRIGLKKYAHGEKAGFAKLTTHQVLEIKSKRLSGTPPSVLCEEYGISAPTVCDIMANRTWKHLTTTKNVDPIPGEFGY